MADQPSAAVTGVSSILAVIGVAGIYVLAGAVNWAVAGLAGGVLVAGFLVWVTTRAISAPPPRPVGVRSSTTTGASSTSAARAAATAAAPSATATKITPTPTAPSTPSVSPAEKARTIWAEATARHDGVLDAYGQWELDPRMLLSYPSLWDYSLPENQEFFSALERASQLRTGDIPGGPGSPDIDAVETFDGVSRRLRKAWVIAEQSARRNGRDLLSESLHKDADRALKLLNHADGASTDAEAASYLTQASGIVRRLAERGVIPNLTRAELELERRRARALGAGSGSGPRTDTGPDTGSGPGA